MEFVSYQQLTQDIRSWSGELPKDLIAVAGVPRSGVLAAGLLALHRNIHLVSIENLIAGKTPWQQPLRRGVAGQSDGRILVLEDSVNTGGTIRAVREKLQGRKEILFGAVYGTEWNVAGVDLIFRQVSLPRCFEWNLFHSDYMPVACLDMDGVLCADWTGREMDSGLELEGYHKHLHYAAPHFLPTTYPVAAIVTSRLEKYRPQTIGWLRKHGVRFRELLMSPHASASERQRAADHAQRKADCYRRRPQTRLFIESQLEQAKEIALRTGRPVLCTDEMRMFTGNERSRSVFMSGQPMPAGSISL